MLIVFIYKENYFYVTESWDSLGHIIIQNKYKFEKQIVVYTWKKSLFSEKSVQCKRSFSYLTDKKKMLNPACILRIFVQNILFLWKKWSSFKEKMDYSNNTCQLS